MISSRASKGFLFAFLLILAGGFLTVGAGLLTPDIQIIGLGGFGFYLMCGVAFILLGVLISFFSLMA